MSNPFSDEYIINEIKDEIEAKKHIAIKGYIRSLIPRYKLTDKIKDKIEKLIDMETQKSKSYFFRFSLKFPKSSKNSLSS